MTLFERVFSAVRTAVSRRSSGRSARNDEPNQARMDENREAATTLNTQMDTILGLAQRSTLDNDLTDRIGKIKRAFAEIGPCDADITTLREAFKALEPLLEESAGKGDSVRFEEGLRIAEEGVKLWKMPENGKNELHELRMKCVRQSVEVLAREIEIAKLEVQISAGNASIQDLAAQLRKIEDASLPSYNSIIDQMNKNRTFVQTTEALKNSSQSLLTNAQATVNQIHQAIITLETPGISSAEVAKTLNTLKEIINNIIVERSQLNKTYATAEATREAQLNEIMVLTPQVQPSKATKDFIDRLNQEKQTQTGHPQPKPARETPQEEIQASQY